MEPLFLCDKDIATLLQVSLSTVSRSAKGKRRNDALKSVKPLIVGGARRWNAHLVATALGITMEQLEDRLH